LNIYFLKAKIKKKLKNHNEIFPLRTDGKCVKKMEREEIK